MVGGLYPECCIPSGRIWPVEWPKFFFFKVYLQALAIVLGHKIRDLRCSGIFNYNLTGHYSSGVSSFARPFGCIARKLVNDKVLFVYCSIIYWDIYPHPPTFSEYIKNMAGCLVLVFAYPLPQMCRGQNCRKIWVIVGLRTCRLHVYNYSKEVHV